MAVTKETVSLEGVLKGEGHERKCGVKVMRHTTYEDAHLLFVFEV
jgi:hypothetical protein